MVTCWERTDLLALLFVMFYCVFVTFSSGIIGPVWCPEWGVVLDCIDSWSLPLYLLSYSLRGLIIADCTTLFTSSRTVAIVKWDWKQSRARALWDIVKNCMTAKLENKMVRTGLGGISPSWFHVSVTSHIETNRYLQIIV